jgi:hypothetical protein
MMDHDKTQRTEEMAHEFMGRATEFQEQFEKLPSSFYYWAVIGSIAGSALLLLMGKSRLAMFVGLWPPTLLNLGLFNKILRPSHDVNQ